jgi:hypothetical protein
MGPYLDPREEVVMRRVPVLVLVMLVSLAGIIAFGRAAPTRAQQATPIAASQSPLIGTWQLDTDTEDPSNPPEIAVFNADGSYLEVATDGAGPGRWESTGGDSANLNIWFLNTDDHGNYTGTTIVRALVHVAADGQSFDADYTLELMMPDGSMSGQYGPGHAHGTLLSVEPMGGPVGPLSDLFQQSEGTPEASPTP